MKHTKIYTNIIFLQKDEDFDCFPGGSEGFWDASLQDQMDYLIGWDYGDTHEAEHTRPPYGSNDSLYYRKTAPGVRYCMSLNQALGYAGLTLEETLLEDEEY